MSVQRGRNASSHACANDEDVRYALQFAEYRTASPAVRWNPLSCCSATYGANAGSDERHGDDRRGADGRANIGHSVHRRRVDATTTTAKPIIKITKTA